MAIWAVGKKISPMNCSSDTTWWTLRFDCWPDLSMRTISPIGVAQFSRSWLRTRKARNHAIAELLDKSLSTVYEYPDDLTTKVDSCIHRRSTQEQDKAIWNCKYGIEILNWVGILKRYYGWSSRHKPIHEVATRLTLNSTKSKKTRGGAASLNRERGATKLKELAGCY